MAHDTPRIDERSFAELVDQTETLFEALTARIVDTKPDPEPGWLRSPPERLDAVGALARVFARMAGHAVQALNRAPDVGQRAFLELVGVRPHPPRVARAPLTFALAEGAATATVPARTQVGASDDDTVRFETEAPLLVTTVRLEHAFTHDAATDAREDLAGLCDPSDRRPRRLLSGARPTLYLGFSRSLGQVPMSMYFGICPLDPVIAEQPVVAEKSAALGPPRLVWEYRTADGWRPMLVDDETRGFVAPGIVRWSTPPGHTASSEGGRAGWWIRVRRDGGAPLENPDDADWLRALRPPRATMLVPHTVWARHATTVRETLGSGDGTVALALRTRQSPVLAGERLEICERTGLPPAEAAALVTAVGPDASARDDGPFGWSLWVRWREVPDFRGSRPDDRHYVLDRARGDVRLGDGVRGRTVPVGQANVRIAYEVGGGAVGNRPAGVLAGLKSSLAGIAGVTNPDVAVGGADAEVLADMVDRGAAALRHQGRAVAARDLEDLARAADPDVARVLAIPPRVDPIAAAVELEGLATADGRVLLPVPPDEPEAGLVRVLVVARGREPRPAASAGLLERVAAHLRAHGPPQLRLDVSGPRWVEVRVTASLVAASHAHAVGLVAAARATLDTFLHPLTGGLHGLGWPFGRVPRASDVNRVLAAVPGVDHLRGLAVLCDPPQPPPTDDLNGEELAALARIMVSPGPHDLTLAGVVGEVS